ncbi:transglycosylase SLT domain-containing protein [Lysobacter enzymogenes]|uniref:transglycosylase SLT domain-containing protein n=1 Tax=Lysobacter enzymogenes TaxID=69 RepID=UPI000895EB88|nr:LysM domain-containing protein [Lysobacter enzymogenes]
MSGPQPSPAAGRRGLSARRAAAPPAVPRRPLLAAVAAGLCWLAALPVAGAAETLAAPAAASEAATRNGREIYQRFRDGLADPSCEPGVSSRWRQHFATAPKRLAAKDDDLLPLFGYVVDALRENHLPTEYALIPFVESGYRPGARSAAGPAGLWQMIAMTARNHRVPMREGYDGRLSPVESTQAAVRYLKTLHGMFGGDWRLTVMAYNAGEYRVFNAIKRAGVNIADARHDQLTGLSDITTAYVRKLHALSCLMEQADDREEWLSALDRPVPRLAAVTVPDGVDSLGEWAARTDQDIAWLQRLNPVFGDGRIGRPGGRRAPLLAVAATAVGAPATTTADVATASGDLPASEVNTRTVANAKPGDAAKNDTKAGAKPGDAAKGDIKIVAAAKPGDSAKSDAKTTVSAKPGDAANNQTKTVADAKPAGTTKNDDAQALAAAESRDAAPMTFGSAAAERPAETPQRPAKPQRAATAAAPRKHTVGRGENPWTIAKRYDVRAADLLKLNGLAANAVLKPGQALLIDPPVGKRK